MIQLPRMAALLIVVLLSVSRADAHPAPFSYLDVHVSTDSIEFALVAHNFDVAHEVGVDQPDRLLDDAVLKEKGPQFLSSIRDRLSVTLDGQRLDVDNWSPLEAIPDRQSVQTHARVSLRRPPGLISIDARLFPYDSVHQTFINVYEGDRLATQAILDVANTQFSYYAATARGAWVVIRTLAPAGLRHILAGAEHLLMLGGLLLLASSTRQWVLIASAFTMGHLVTLTLSSLSLVTPPIRLIEPAIALSIIYVGLDNLMVRGGRDIRPWLSFAFGALHGFGFAATLRTMQLPRPALLWAIVSFNLGVQAGQLLAALVLATTLAAVRSRGESIGQRLTFAGSIAVIAVGTLWFVQRVFFPGAMA